MISPGEVVGVWMRPEWRLARLPNPFEGVVVERRSDFGFESWGVETRIGSDPGVVWSPARWELIIVSVTPALGDVMLPRIEWKAPVEHDGHVIEPEAFPFEAMPKVQIARTRCAACGFTLTREQLDAMGLR